MNVSQKSPAVPSQANVPNDGTSLMKLHEKQGKKNGKSQYSYTAELDVLITRTKRPHVALLILD